jgi:hypothetical protein
MNVSLFIGRALVAFQPYIHPLPNVNRFREESFRSLTLSSKIRCNARYRETQVNLSLIHR